MEDERLIEEVYKYKFIYDKSDAKHSNKGYIGKAWADIAKELNCNDDMAAPLKSELEYLSNRPDGTYVFNHEPDIREYRITVPMTLEEYRIGHLYTTAQVSLSETGAGEGVEILKNEIFDRIKGERSPVRLQANGQLFEKGQFTRKIYHIKRRMPRLIQALAPMGSLEIHERSYNCFPFCRSVLSNAYMKDKFYCIIDSYYAADRGDADNIFDLVGRELNERKISKIDIVNDLKHPKDYKAEWDPCLVTSAKTGRPALPKDVTGEWINTTLPVMTCYKLVRFHFKWFGMTQKVLGTFHKEFERFFLNFNRQLVCTVDDYIDLTIEDIRNMEKETTEDLNKLRAYGEPRGLISTN